MKWGSRRIPRHCVRIMGEYVWIVEKGIKGTTYTTKHVISRKVIFNDCLNPFAKCCPGISTSEMKFFI